MDMREPQHADPTDWQDSRDIEREAGTGWGPRYLRCCNPRCLALVTDGQILLGGCQCGAPRLMPAGSLTVDELDGLYQGQYPLTQREFDLIQPVKDCVVTKILD